MTLWSFDRVEKALGSGYLWLQVVAEKVLRGIRNRRRRLVRKRESGGGRAGLI